MVRIAGVTGIQGPGVPRGRAVWSHGCPPTLPGEAAALWKERPAELMKLTPTWELLHFWWLRFVSEKREVKPKRGYWRLPEGREQKNHCLEMSKYSMALSSC